MVTRSPTNSLATNFRIASAPQISRRLSLTYPSGGNVATILSVSKALTAARCSAMTAGTLEITLLVMSIYPSGQWARYRPGWLPHGSFPHGRGKTRSTACLSHRGRHQTGIVTSMLAIGDFSRATHLSVKMLRHYH